MNTKIPCKDKENLPKILSIFIKHNYYIKNKIYVKYNYILFITKIKYIYIKQN